MARFKDIQHSSLSNLASGTSGKAHLLPTSSAGIRARRRLRSESYLRDGARAVATFERKPEGKIVGTVFSHGMGTATRTNLKVCSASIASRQVAVLDRRASMDSKTQVIVVQDNGGPLSGVSQ